ncbi:hypothetical protein [Bradyrhizobium sp. ORS 285]|uniref:hypothetical protein n=1 Tax=Bradyrhizobium sp. ORS 285 TaxID=115808 RepID=UPI001111A93B|nr:hypothetical protein [Bradyrhizobium sp. ORS 285]
MFLPVTCHAAWTASDNFESYSNGASLSGASGGSGWNGNWTTTLGTWSVQNATAANSTTLSGNTTSGSATLNRTITSISIGSYCFYMRNGSTTGNWYHVLNNSTGQATGYAVLMGFESGNIVAYNGGTGTTLLTGYNINQWYKICIDFGSVANTYKVSIDGGAYSSNLNFGTTGAVTNFQFYFGGGTGPNFSFDEIAPASGGSTYSPYVLEILSL